MTQKPKDEAAAAAGETPEFSFERAFRITAEVTSIVLIIGFVVSAAINQLVFARWGLSFLMIADPSDVLMSGLGFLFDTFQALFVALLLALMVLGFLAHKEGETIQLRGALIWGPTVLLALAISAFFIGIPLDEGLTAAIHGEDLPLRAGINGSTAALVCGLAAALFAAGVYFSHEEWRGWQALVLGAIGIGGTVAAYNGGASLIVLRDDTGYYSRFVALSAGAPAACTATPVHLLWSGSSKAVVRCASGASRATFVLNAGDISYTSVPRDFGCHAPRANLRWRCRVLAED